MPKKSMVRKGKGGQAAAIRAAIQALVDEGTLSAGTKPKHVVEKLGGEIDTSSGSVKSQISTLLKRAKADKGLLAEGAKADRRSRAARAEPAQERDWLDVGLKVIQDFKGDAEEAKKQMESMRAYIGANENLDAIIKAIDRIVLIKKAVK